MTPQGFMRQALADARLALDKGEVPVGAVLVRGDKVLARGHNLRQTTGDPTAHAEILVLREAARRLGTWRLDGTSMYVTLEPCPMCAGALVLARVQKLVFGASDPRAGATGTLYNIVQDGRLNHRLEVMGGILEKECRDILRAFFDGKRDPEGCQSG